MTTSQREWRDGRYILLMRLSSTCSSATATTLAQPAQQGQKAACGLEILPPRPQGQGVGPPGTFDPTKALRGTTGTSHRCDTGGVGEYLDRRYGPVVTSTTGRRRVVPVTSADRIAMEDEILKANGTPRTWSSFPTRTHGLNGGDPQEHLEAHQQSRRRTGVRGLPGISWWRFRRWT